MARQRRKLRGVATYFVVTRDEETGERLNYKGFTDREKAESYQRQEAEKPDMPGHACVVEIEVLLTGAFPGEFKTKR